MPYHHDPLNNKEKLFLSYYKVHFNQTKAAEQMGYANPTSAGIRIMARARVKKAVRELQHTIARRTEVTGDRLRLEVAYNALRDPIDLCDSKGALIVDNMHRIPEHIRRCIDGIEVKQYTDRDGNVEQVFKLKLVSKHQSQELLAKMIGAIEPEQRAVAVKGIWDALYSLNGDGVPDLIEGKLKQLEDLSNGHD